MQGHIKLGKMMQTSAVYDSIETGILEWQATSITRRQSLSAVTFFSGYAEHGFGKIKTNSMTVMVDQIIKQKFGAATQIQNPRLSIPPHQGHDAFIPVAIVEPGKRGA